MSIESNLPDQQVDETADVPPGYWEALQRWMQGNPPEGFVIVPREPTDAMIDAAMNRYKHPSDAAARHYMKMHRENFRHDYKAMIEAIPKMQATKK